jgi:3-oxoacyl-[acyl-carrier protein] reductase
MKQIGHPKDHASLTQFLLDPKSSWITGQIFHVDGGSSTIH